MKIFSTSDAKLAFQTHYIMAMYQGMKVKLSKEAGRWEILAV